MAQIQKDAQHQVDLFKQDCDRRLSEMATKHLIELDKVRREDEAKISQHESTVAKGQIDKESAAEVTRIEKERDIAIAKIEQEAADKLAAEWPSSPSWWTTRTRR